MRRPTSFTILFATLACIGPITAQDFPDRIGRARQRIHGAEWTAALDLLLDLTRQATTDVQRADLAACLSVVGKGLEDTKALEAALRAREAALALHRQLHGGADHADVATSLDTMSWCLQLLGRTQDALACSEEALAIRARWHGDRDHADLVKALGNTGAMLFQLDRAADALPLLERAVAMGKRLDGERPTAFLADRLSNLAHCLKALGRDEEALARWEESLAMQRSAPDDLDQESVAGRLLDVADCLLRLHRAGEALAPARQALAIREPLHAGAEHQDLVTCLTILARCHEDLGQPREAQPYLQRAVAMLDRIHEGADHAVTAKRLQELGESLRSTGQDREALPWLRRALEMQERLCGGRDHQDVLRCLNRLGQCLLSLDEVGSALPVFERALAMSRRLHFDRDHRAVVAGLSNVAHCLARLERPRDALSLCEEAIAMQQRLQGDDKDDATLATNLHVSAVCLRDLGRVAEALPRFEAALAMSQRLAGDKDNMEVALALGAIARCLEALGRPADALPLHQQAYAMARRLHGDRDHARIAGALSRLAACLLGLGRADQALPLSEQAVAMFLRVHDGADHADVASGLNTLALCLNAVGQVDEALRRLEQAEAMDERWSPGTDASGVATRLHNLAGCYRRLGRHAEALQCSERALASFQRLNAGDHPRTASALCSVALHLFAVGRHAEALLHAEQGVAMRERLLPGGDSVETAVAVNCLGRCLYGLGRTAEALAQHRAALAMLQRLHGQTDHPNAAVVLTRIATCARELGHPQEAMAAAEQAAAMIERLRNSAQVSAEVRQSFFDELKDDGAFEQLQELAAALGMPAQGLSAAERGRGRWLLDLLESQRFDALAEALQRARARGDETARQRLEALQRDLAAAELASDRSMHMLSMLSDIGLSPADCERRRHELLAEQEVAQRRLRQLADERARALADISPVGKVGSVAEIQAALRPAELLLEFTITSEIAVVYVVPADGDIAMVPLPEAHATLATTMQALVRHAAHDQTAERGRDPQTPSSPTSDNQAAASRALFASLFPPAVWQRIKTAARVFVVAHRELHRLPFELLVTDVRDGKPVFWLDDGPPIGYVPSGTALRWLRQRAAATRDDTTSLDLLAISDPGALDAEPIHPEAGAFVAVVEENGEGARAGMRPGDVLLAYDGQPVADDRSLRDLRTATEAAIEDGGRNREPIPLRLWRRGQELEVRVAPGPLGVRIGRGGARAAYEATLGSDARAELVLRAGDLERIGRLPRLRGARAEGEAIARVFADAGRTAQHLSGTDATEPAVFDLAAKAKYLHFACHGLAEEYAGQSLSLLVLSQPRHVLPGDDGLLKLGDLFRHWRSRLASCRLVVLSACRTNVGPTHRDEAPQALPIGFLFAGAPAVISSLWAVDDASTKALMTDFYGRLLAGETDKLAAFTAAKKALRARYPDPFHWAPFLYMGSPD